MAPALPEPGHVTGDVFVLIGSVRGFCSSFNEDVLGFWQRSKKADDSTIVVGERLISLIHGEESVVFVPGATNSNGVMPVIESILSAYGQICEKSDLNLGLVIVLRGADGVITKRLWPMQSEVSSKLKEIPHTNEAPSLVAGKCCAKLPVPYAGFISVACTAYGKPHAFDADGKCNKTH